MSKDKEYKLAVVDWVDAWLGEVLERDTQMVRHTAGWLVHNNSKIVRIALTLDSRGPADIMNIPRSLVKSIEIFAGEVMRPEEPEDQTEPPTSLFEDAERKGY